MQSINNQLTITKICSRKEVEEAIAEALEINNKIFNKKLNDIQCSLDAVINGFPKTTLIEIQDTLKQHMTEQVQHEMFRKQVLEKLDVVMPVSEDIKDIETFFKVGKRIGLGLVFISVTAGAIFGMIYAIKEWIKKD
jgi:hypothetical protein